MKKLFLPFLVLCTTIFMISCDAKRDGNGDLLLGLHDIDVTDDPINTSSSKLIKKMIEKDADGETLTVDYTYNADKLQTVKVVSTDDINDFYTLYYDANILSRITLKQIDSGDEVNYDFKLKYTDGKLTTITGNATIGSVEAFVVNTIIDYNADNTVKHMLTTHTNAALSTPILSLESTFKIENNNVSYWKLTTTVGGPITVPPIETELTLSNYDKKNNPFKAIPKAFNIFACSYGYGSHALTGLSANNYQNAKISVLGINQDITASYTYDSDDYPTKVTRSDTGNTTFVY